MLYVLTVAGFYLMITNKRRYLLLGLVMLASGILGAALLTHGHVWGDDFASYLLQAQSITTGRLQEFAARSIFTIEESSYKFGPVAAPWGFPLMLAPVYAVFGLNMLAFKLVLTTCYMLFLAALFLLARHRLNDTQALLLTAFMAFNPYMLRAQNVLLSDLPFLMWSTAGLWLVELYGEDQQARSRRIGLGAAVGAIVFCAAITRFNGFLLFIPLAAEQILRVQREHVHSGESRTRRIIELAIPYLVCGLCYGAQAWLLPNLNSGLREQLQGLSLQSVWQNAQYYLLLTGDFLEGSIRGGYYLYAVMAAGFVFAIVKRWRQDLMLLLYILATIALYILFPQVQGPRYIFPVLPLFFLIAFEGMMSAVQQLKTAHQRLGRALVYAAWSAMTLAFLWVSAAEARQNLLAGREAPAGPYSPAAVSMLSYVRESTPLGSSVIFYKPRAMRLFTDRDSFLSLECGDLGKADYVVTVRRGGAYNQISPTSIETCNPAVSVIRVFRNSMYDVYRIGPRAEPATTSTPTP